jgi:hypothetical protein
LPGQWGLRWVRLAQQRLYSGTPQTPVPCSPALRLADGLKCSATIDVSGVRKHKWIGLLMIHLQSKMDQGAGCHKKLHFDFCSPRQIQSLHIFRSNISSVWLVNICTMKTAPITTAGIAFCGVLITAMTVLGDTVVVPHSRTTVITAVPAPPTINSFVRDLDSSRYQLIEKKDNKEVYRDTQTGEKWIVEIHHRNG